MDRRRFDQPDLLFGVFLVMVAAGTFVAARHLAVGTAAEMGPGYMPRVVATGVLGFGLYFTGRGLIAPARRIDPVKLRPLVGILASVAVFAVLVVTAGLALASLATIVAAGFASSETRPLENIVFGTALAAAAVMLFVKALSLPVPIWPW
jgi:Tripartite tricarboxylate transporter TctB family